MKMILVRFAFAVLLLGMGAFFVFVGAAIVWEGARPDSGAVGVMTMLFAVIPATLAGLVLFVRPVRA